MVDGKFYEMFRKEHGMDEAAKTVTFAKDVSCLKLYFEGRTRG